MWVWTPRTSFIWSVKSLRRLFQGKKRLHCSLKGRAMARKDEWRCGLATFQRVLAKVKKWDEPWDLKSVWAKVVPLTVLSFSFAEFVFPLVAIMLVASSPASVVFLPNFHWGVCCCLEWLLYLAGFYLLATIVHPLEPGWVFTLRMCVCVRFFPLTVYADQCDIQLESFFFGSRLLTPGRLIGEIVYLDSLVSFQRDSWRFEDSR